MNDYMKLAFDEAQSTMTQNYGGPFGACIVKDGNIIAVSSNTVLHDHDPSAHAEINAIREAGKKLGTHDLSGCELYATGYPCPMCLSAIVWANIKKVYYGTTLSDAEEIGFRDDFIYKSISNGDFHNNSLELENIDRDECLELFKQYTSEQKQIY